MNLDDSYAQLTAKGEVTFTRLLPGPVERVWSYFAESEKRGRWLASGELEDRVGGKLELRFSQADLSDEKTPPPGYAHLADGTRWTSIITHYRSPDLLGFTWEAGKERSEVIVHLTPEDRMVRIVLTHRRLANIDAERNAACGWHIHLDVLLAVLEGNSPPPYWTELQRMKSAYADLIPPE